MITWDLVKGLEWVKPYLHLKGEVANNITSLPIVECGFNSNLLHKKVRIR